jgi:hypothetical protein
MLEEDALRFDAFLKENDEKVQEAIKHADTEAKAKQDKVSGAAVLTMHGGSVPWGVVGWGGWVWWSGNKYQAWCVVVAALHLFKDAGGDQACRHRGKSQARQGEWGCSADHGLQVVAYRAPAVNI